MSCSISRCLRALAATLVVGAACGESHATAAENGDASEGEIETDQGLRPFRPMYEAYSRPGRRERHYVRAGIEQLVILGAGTGWYWIWPEINKADWDFPDYPTRMANMTPSFDSNMHFTNDVLHPFAGSLYYGAARVNGLSPAVSVTYAIASSALFEWFLEFLEKASINDMIMTPMGGMPPGEFFLHLGDYLNSAPHLRWYHEPAGVLLGIPQRVHRIANGEVRVPGPPELGADALGYSAYYSHQFDTVGEVSLTTNDAHRSGFLYGGSARAEIVSIPGFLRPGHIDFTFDDGDFTDAYFKGAVSTSGEKAFDFGFDANLWGRYTQDISPARRGTASMIALSSSMRFFDRLLLGRRDQFGLANLFGPEVKLWAIEGDFVARLDAAAHLDFAVVRSLAYPLWVDRYGMEGTKSALQEQGYDFAFGPSAWLRGVLRLHELELATRAFFGIYNSFDRWDRFQSEVTHNIHTRESIFELEGWIGWTPVPVLQVRIFAEQLGRTSEMAPYYVVRWDRRYGGGLGLRF